MMHGLTHDLVPDGVTLCPDIACQAIDVDPVFGHRVEGGGGGVHDLGARSRPLDVRYPRFFRINFSRKITHCT